MGGGAASSPTGGAAGRGGSATGGAGFRAGGSRTGGNSGSGGATGTAGRSGTGGFTAASGGASGGAIGRGGSPGATGGASGGATGRGGSPGASGGASGGASATGGAASGGTSGLDGGAGSSGSCGNAVIEPGEQCDLGEDNDDGAAFAVTQEGRTFAASPWVGSVSSAELSAYSSWSTHTGFEALGASRIFLYIYPAALELALFMVHGVDQDSTGQEQPTSHVAMSLSGLPETTIVSTSDDSSELWMTSATTASGFWTFTSNSDGGSLSGLPLPGDWEVVLEPTFVDGIATWDWIRGDGVFVPLDLTKPLTLRARNHASRCRTDCTIPRCGDGLLDGGEVCDRPPSGATCAADCGAFE